MAGIKNTLVFVAGFAAINSAMVAALVFIAKGSGAMSAKPYRAHVKIITQAGGIDVGMANAPIKVVDGWQTWTDGEKTFKTKAPILVEEQ